MIRSAEGLERLRRLAGAAAAAVAESALARAREPRRALPLRLPDRGRGVRRPRRPPARAASRCSSHGADRRGARPRRPRRARRGRRRRRPDDRGRRSRRTRAAAPSSCSRSRASSAASRPRARCSRRSTRPSRSSRSLEEGAPCRGARRASPGSKGPARAILTGERTALNLLGRLCGIATLTARYVELVAGTGATILDTRKTTPGLRALEKYAVRCGGGTNHRAGLYDAILLKENHLRIAGGIARRGRARSATATARPVEVEAETLDEVAEALEAGVDRILLDNMTPGRGRAGRRARRRPRAARGLGRHHARDRPRLRRDRRRLHLRRRADALGALARRLAGGRDA